MLRTFQFQYSTRRLLAVHHAAGQADAEEPGIRTGTSRNADLVQDLEGGEFSLKARASRRTRRFFAFKPALLKQVHAGHDRRRPRTPPGLRNANAMWMGSQIGSKAFRGWSSGAVTHAAARPTKARGQEPREHRGLGDPALPGDG